MRGGELLLVVPPTATNRFVPEESVPKQTDRQIPDVIFPVSQPSMPLGEHISFFRFPTIVCLAGHTACHRSVLR